MKKLFTLSLMALVASQAFAAEFPIKDKPVTIIVPFAAGGPTDRVARDLQQALGKSFPGTSFVIDNAAGGPGGLIGATKAARATPDGHTLMVHHIAMGVFPSFVKNMPFKIDSDFEYLGMINEVPMTLIGRANLPAKNFAELKTWMAANKGKINLGNAGSGSASHLCGMMFQAAVNTDMTTIPYKGTAPAMNDLSGGQIDLMCDQTTNTSAQIEAGKVKAYGVTTSKRLTTPALKNLPTLQEDGLKGFEVNIWHGLYAPKGTPADVVTKINAALKTALKDADFVKKQEALGAVIITDKRVDSAEHKKFVAAENARWTPIIKAAGNFTD